MNSAGKHKYYIGPEGQPINPARNGGRVRATKEFIEMYTRFRIEQDAVCEAEADGVKIDHGYEDEE